MAKPDKRVTGDPATRLQVVRLRADVWADPLDVVAGFADHDGICALLSAEGEGRPSYVLAQPERVLVRDRLAIDVLFSDLSEPGLQQGTIALASYDAGARPATGDRGSALPLSGSAGDGWPDMILVHYRAWLAFDPAAGVIEAVGLGSDMAAARAAAMRSLDWLSSAQPRGDPPPPVAELPAEAPANAYESGVREIVGQIRRGDLFQANLARAWSSTLRPGASPFDTLHRLAGRSSAYGAGLQVGDRALVSNSPELFVSYDPASGRIETRPIKGTRATSSDPRQDRAIIRELADSAKDRAENLMIVDLMRNDLSRASQPGSVRVDRLQEVQSLPTVHHLVSTISAQAAAGVGAAEILAATFPPGSITGAPKHQAMKVIATLEPPRGPWCGSLVFMDEAGHLTASVLIRTAAFGRREGQWTVRTLAGAGIVADSDPDLERRECNAKVRAIAEALTGGAPEA